MIRSDLWNYCDAYIVMKGTTYLVVAGNNVMAKNGVVLENNAPFRSCMSNFSNTFIDNAEDLDIVMSMSK